MSWKKLEECYLPVNTFLVIMPPSWTSFDPNIVLNPPLKLKGKKTHKYLHRHSPIMT